MNWSWLTGDLTEHEMELEHGLELEKIKAEEKEKGVDGPPQPGARGGKATPFHGEGEKKGASIRRFYGIVRNLNQGIKEWKGVE